MATYGNVGEIKESEESWTQYAERLKQYFTAKKIKGARNKALATLLSICGCKTYGLICDLLQPQKPGDANLKVIYKKLENYFSPKPNVIVKQFKFHSRNHLERENVAEFVAGLRRLSEQHPKTFCGIDLFMELTTTAFNDDCWPNMSSHSKKQWKLLQQESPSNDHNVNKVTKDFKPPNQLK